MAVDAQGLRELRAALQRGERILCVHYACENFFEVKDRPAAITCIAISEIGANTEEVSFSIMDAPPNENIENRERDLLQRFYAMLKSAPDARIIHWNMNSASYGFSAIAARYRFLFDEDAPIVPTVDRRYDLDDLITTRFGEGYAGHPKFRTLASLNHLYMPFFLAGKQEAEAATKGEYGTITRSTSEKAHLVAVLCGKLFAGTLKTSNSVGSVKFAGEHIDAVALVLALGQRFRDVERALKRRHGNRNTLAVSDEYDAQDLLRALLVQFFDDVRDEEYTPSYAGGASRIDFILPEFALAIELKYARSSMTTADVGGQLLIDRDRYAKHPSVSHLICLVFDHEGIIRNPRGLEQDLSREHRTEALAVSVRIYDR